MGNLPYSTDEQALAAFFQQYGATNPRIIEGRGFGFADIDADQLEAAVADKSARRWTDAPSPSTRPLPAVAAAAAVAAAVAPVAAAVVATAAVAAATAEAAVAVPAVAAAVAVATKRAG